MLALVEPIVSLVDRLLQRLGVAGETQLGDLEDAALGFIQQIGRGIAWSKACADRSWQAWIKLRTMDFCRTMSA